MSEEVGSSRAQPYPDRREHRVSWYLHAAVVEKLDTVEGARIIDGALAQADIMKARQRSPMTIGWMEQWEELLRGDREDLKRSMLEVSTLGEDLRQMSPFISALSPEERLVAIRRATAPTEKADE